MSRLQELERENERPRELLTKRSRSVANPVLAAYYKAVDRRISEFSELDGRTAQSRRMWIAGAVKRAVGIKRIDQLTQEHLEKALVVIHTFGRYASWDHGQQLCACDICLPRLVEHARDLHRQAAFHRNQAKRSTGRALEYEELLARVETFLATSSA